jgi:hypothetical protein
MEPIGRPRNILELFINTKVPMFRAIQKISAVIRLCFRMETIGRPRNSCSRSFPLPITRVGFLDEPEVLALRSSKDVQPRTEIKISNVNGSRLNCGAVTNPRFWRSNV